MRRPDQDEKLAARNAVGAWIQSTSRMPNPAASYCFEYSGLIAKALPQKKQSWWISTTSRGDFQPKKTLI